MKSLSGFSDGKYEATTDRKHPFPFPTWTPVQPELFEQGCGQGEGMEMLTFPTLSAQARDPLEASP